MYSMVKLLSNSNMLLYEALHTEMKVSMDATHIT